MQGESYPELIKSMENSTFCHFDSSRYGFQQSLFNIIAKKNPPFDHHNSMVLFSYLPNTPAEKKKFKKIMKIYHLRIAMKMG